MKCVTMLVKAQFCDLIASFSSVNYYKTNSTSPPCALNACISIPNVIKAV
jgi:hypothetical protein